MNKANIGLVGVACVGTAFLVGVWMSRQAAPVPDNAPAETAPAPPPVAEPNPTDTPLSEAPSIRMAEALDVDVLPSSEWVSIHDPEQSWNGYTLVFYKHRVPLLVDMNGRVVHSWPKVRAVGRARLTPKGHLVYIGVDDSLSEVDWDGKPVRHFSTGDSRYFPHHDLQWTPDNELVGIFRATGRPTDNVLIVDGDGALRWTWESHVHIAEDLEGEAYIASDLTHFNSVQSIPDNPHARAGDARFAPGNILVSSRHLNAVYLIDRSTGEVTWKYTDDLDWQHEAILLGDDIPGAGNVLLFNNRYHSPERQSEIIEIDPTTNQVVWRYTDERFFSDVSGTSQKLPNGNVLISSSRGSRVFEVTSAGDIVWQWTPPFETLRARRYGPDHCPQLAALPPQEATPVLEAGREPHIDTVLYDFVLTNELIKAMVAGGRRRLMRKASDCQELILPEDPGLMLEYGFSGSSLSPEQATGQLRITLARPGDAPQTVYDVQVSRDADGEWIRDRVRLPAALSSSTVEMCIESNAPDFPTGLFEGYDGFVVQAPRIQSIRRGAGQQRLPHLSSAHDRRSLAAEQNLQERQLRELGYIE